MSGKNTVLFFAILCAPFALPSFAAADSAHDPRQLYASGEGAALAIKNGQSVTTSHPGAEGAALYAADGASASVANPQKSGVSLRAKGKGALGVIAKGGARVNLGRGSTVKTDSGMPLYIENSEFEADNLKIESPTCVETVEGYPARLGCKMNIISSEASLGDKTSVRVNSAAKGGTSGALSQFAVYDGSLTVGNDFYMLNDAVHGAFAVYNSSLSIGKNAMVERDQFGSTVFDLYGDTRVSVDSGGYFEGSFAVVRFWGGGDSVTVRDSVLKSSAYGIWDQSSGSSEVNIIGGELACKSSAIHVSLSLSALTSCVKSFNFSGGAKIYGDGGFLSGTAGVVGSGDYEINVNASGDGTEIGGGVSFNLSDGRGSLNFSVTDGAMWDLSGNPGMTSLHLDGARLRLAFGSDSCEVRTSALTLGGAKNSILLTLSEGAAAEGAQAGRLSVELSGLFLKREGMSANSLLSPEGFDAAFDVAAATYNDSYRWDVRREGAGYVFENFRPIDADGANILADPADASGYEKGSAEFSVTARAPGKIKYQWQYSSDGGTKWKNVGKNSETLRLEKLKPEQDGYLYRCAVSSGKSAATSGPAALSVVRPSRAAVKTNPRPQECLTTGQAEFFVEAAPESGEAVSYRWEVMKPGTDKWVSAGSSKQTLVVKKPALKLDGAKYRCLLSNHVHAKGEYTPSEAAELRVLEAAKIKKQASAELSLADGMLSASVGASGDNLRYRWEISRDGGRTWETVEGADSASPEFGFDPGRGDAQFRCVVWNDGYESAAVASKPVSVKDAGSFEILSLEVSHAGGKDVFTGEDLPCAHLETYREGAISMKVLAKGRGLKYQWYSVGDSLGRSPIKGATGSAYRLAEYEENAGYVCRVYSGNSYAEVYLSIYAEYPPLPLKMEGTSAEVRLGGQTHLEVSFFKGSACSVAVRDSETERLVAYGRKASYSYKRTDFWNANLAIAFDEVPLDESGLPSGASVRRNYSGKIAIVGDGVPGVFDFRGRETVSKSDFSAVCSHNVHQWLEVPKDMKGGTNFVVLRFAKCDTDGPDLPFEGFYVQTYPTGKVCEFGILGGEGANARLLSHSYAKSGDYCISFSASFTCDGVPVKIAKTTFGGFFPLVSPDSETGRLAGSYFNIPVEVDVGGVKRVYPAVLAYDRLPYAPSPGGCFTINGSALNPPGSFHLPSFSVDGDSAGSSSSGSLSLDGSQNLEVTLKLFESDSFFIAPDGELVLVRPEGTDLSFGGFDDWSFDPERAVLTIKFVEGNGFSIVPVGGAE